MASILIVDDSLPCRNAAAALLRADGHQVNSADNAWRGLVILESMPIDLVILDIHLPGLNGFGFLKDMQNGRHRDVPVIIATALDMDQSLLDQVRPQAKRWLIKGQYTGQDFLQTVNQQLPATEALTSAA
jgi:two-component system chemotaxis sensor kinase CheA